MCAGRILGAAEAGFPMMPKLKGSHSLALIVCHTSDQPVPGWLGLKYFRDLIASPSGNGLYAW